MTRAQRIRSLFFACALCVTAAPHAEIVSSSATHYVLRLEAVSALAPDALWQLLIEPATWWHPDHTYSGDAANLELEARAGGLWTEEWDNGSVAHGRVLLVEPGRRLRLEAPFGPLQAIGAYVVWTITITAVDSGTLIVFDEVATAPPNADMATLAPAVERVKAEALARLVAFPDRNFRP